MKSAIGFLMVWLAPFLAVLEGYHAREEKPLVRLALTMLTFLLTGWHGTRLMEEHDRERGRQEEQEEEAARAGEG